MSLGPTPRRSFVDWMSLFSLALIWGTSFGFVKVALRGVGPVTLAAGRIVAGALVLTALVAVLRMPFPRGRSFWCHAALLALFGNALPFFAISWGQQRVDSGPAGVLMAVMPLVTLVLAHLFTDGDRLSTRKVLGFLLGFSGIAVLVGPDALRQLGGSGQLLRQLAILSGAVCYAIGTIITRRMPKAPIVVSGSAVLLLASSMILPAALLFERPWRAAPEAASVLAVIWLGIVPTALATLIYFRVVQGAGASFLSLINFQIPVVAVVVGVLVLGEKPEPQLFYSLGLVLLGLAVSQVAPSLGRRRRGAGG